MHEPFHAPSPVESGFTFDFTIQKFEAMPSASPPDGGSTRKSSDSVTTTPLPGSAAVNVTGYSPTAVGVPVNSPLVVLYEMPSGRPIDVYVTPVPPLVETTMGGWRS